MYINSNYKQIIDRSATDLSRYHIDEKIGMYDVLNEVNKIINEDGTNNLHNDEKTFYYNYSKICSEYSYSDEFKPERWILVQYGRDELDKLIYYTFMDKANQYTYKVNSDHKLIYINRNSSGINNLLINAYIPNSLWYKIENVINYTRSIIDEPNKLWNKHEVTIKKNKKMKVSKEQEELINFLSSLNDKTFDEIFMEIVKFRINKYNKGHIIDEPFPYGKTTVNISNLLDILVENNYEKYPSLKKWADKVIFLT